jgi:hypothetical protein
LIKHALNVININDKGYNNDRLNILSIMQQYHIDDYKGNNDEDEDMVYRDEYDVNLVNCIRLYLDMQKSKQNRKADNEDNEIASDAFIFEKTIKQVAKDMYGKDNVKQKIAKRNGIGQSLEADTYIIRKSGYIILDAKFYSKSFMNSDKCEATYSVQTNRYQMNAYMTALSDRENNKNVLGIIIHAIDSEGSDKYKIINHGAMDIAESRINLELVDISTSASDIKQQIKDIISMYDKKLLKII